MLFKFNFFRISTINLLKKPLPCTNNFDFIAQYKSTSAFPESKCSACNSFITLFKYSFDKFTHSPQFIELGLAKKHFPITYFGLISSASNDLI